MLDDFLPLIAALVAAVAIYALRERHRRRTRVHPLRPDITLPEAFDLWRAPEGFDPSPEVRAQARESLLEVDGMRALRREIIRSATTALYLDMILALPDAERAVLLKGYEPGMDALVRQVRDVSTIRWMVLREYGRLKYDDAVPEDWFEQYLNVARPYIREKVRLAREHLVELDQGAARLVEIYDELLKELETKLIESPPKKRYPPPDLS